MVVIGHAARLRIACDDIDVMDMLSDIKVPTLVHDHVSPYEQGRLLATRIPGARLMTLESENHIPEPDDPAWNRLMEEIETFASGA
jgi:pimeloyl-ACP methyl ester carboxylesterase